MMKLHFVLEKLYTVNVKKQKKLKVLFYSSPSRNYHQCWHKGGKLFIDLYRERFKKKIDFLIAFFSRY